MVFKSFKKYSTLRTCRIYYSSLFISCVQEEINKVDLAKFHLPLLPSLLLCFMHSNLQATTAKLSHQLDLASERHRNSNYQRESQDIFIAALSLLGDGVGSGYVLLSASTVLS